jgi:peptide/nickel transport system substrate-binding protein
MLGQVCESLIAMDTKRQVKPMLADKWEMSPDGKTYTFYLHKGVQFQGGWGELTAEDVKYTIERIINEKISTNPHASLIRNLVDSIQVADPYKVVFNLKTPSWNLLQLINHMDPVSAATITSKKYVESVGDAKVAQQPIGTGPWKLVEYQKGNYYKFEAVENHWRQTPRFKNLVIKLIPDEATRLAMIKTGELDITAISLATKKEAERQGIKVRSNPGVNQQWLQLGAMIPPRYATFDPSVPWVPISGDAKASERALKVRKALNLAIDKEQIAKEIYYGEVVLTSVAEFSPGLPSTDPRWKPYPFDPQQAKKLLIEAGYPNGFDKPIEMWLVPKPGSEELPDVGQAVGMMWEKNLGLKINYVTMDYAAFRPQAAARKWKNAMFVRAEAIQTTPEPGSVYQVIGYKGGRFCNLFENDTTDQVIAQIISELDSRKRATLHRELGQYIYDNYLAIPLGQKNALYAVSDRIGDYPMVPGRISSANLVFDQVTPAK